MIFTTLSQKTVPLFDASSGKSSGQSFASPTMAAHVIQFFNLFSSFRRLLMNVTLKYPFPGKSPVFMVRLSTLRGWWVQGTARTVTPGGGWTTLGWWRLESGVSFLCGASLMKVACTPISKCFFRTSNMRTCVIVYVLVAADGLPLSRECVKKMQTCAYKYTTN